MALRFAVADFDGLYGTSASSSALNSRISEEHRGEEKWRFNILTN